MAGDASFRFILTDEEIKELGLKPKIGKNNKRYYLNANRRQRLGELRGITIDNKKRKHPTKAEMHDDNRVIKEERNDGATYSYSGSQSIQDLETALEFFAIDTDKFEVDKFQCNSWDVTNRHGKVYTNYQVKLFLKKIQQLVVPQPKVEPFLFHKGMSKAPMWLVIGCIHRPFHNEKVWYGLMQMIHEHKKNIQGIIINGDYLDLRSLSSHDDFIPEGLDLGIEYSDGLKGMLEIKEAFGKRYKHIEKVFHFGNHEDRFYRYREELRKYGSTLITPEQALHLDEDGWEIQTDWKEGYTTLGNNTDVFHGIYYGTNPSKSHLDKAPTRNMIFNHSHRFSSFSNGKATAYNIGWLGDVNSEGFKYAHRFTRAEWQMGFGAVYLNNHGDSFVQPIRCTNEGFFFGGKSY